jgi:hypothetical protein
MEQLEQKAYQQYELQKTNLISTATLANNPAVHSFFTDLLRNSAGKFASSKNLDTGNYQLDFGGFYQGEQQDQKQINYYRKLGNCCFTPKNKQTVISLNQVYLLNKLGYKRYFATPELYLEIDFNNLLKTCSHELAHYFQFVKCGESSCQSDLGTDKYITELAKEHEKFTQKIYGMIKNSGEYEELERKWKEIG